MSLQLTQIDSQEQHAVHQGSVSACTPDLGACKFRRASPEAVVFLPDNYKENPRGMQVRRTRGGQ